MELDCPDDLSDRPVRSPEDRATEVVVDNLAMIIGRASKSDGNESEIVVKTTEPPRTFLLKVGERISLETAADSASADIELPAESFIRLVYGRLDSDHAPPGIDGPVLDWLRAMFPGF